MSSPADGLALGAMLLFKTIDRDDVPRTILLKIAYPNQVGRVPCETVGQVYDFFNFQSCSRQLPNTVGQVRRQIVVKEKFQAASLSSNSIASLTIFGVMLNTRATIDVSPASARYEA